MKIISHRGYWTADKEKNSLEAFQRSLASGFGIETDLRDYNQQLVISHDIAGASCIAAEKFFEICQNINSSLTLALNIKSDGLQQKLNELLNKYQISNYFVFDMNTPDALIYLKSGFNTFTRQSDYENQPHFYQQAHGVWMDSFEKDWINRDDIQFHLKQDKMVCLVSPELHQRDHMLFWQKLAAMPAINNPHIFLCTDYPNKAKEFFHGKD